MGRHIFLLEKTFCCRPLMKIEKDVTKRHRADVNLRKIPKYKSLCSVPFFTVPFWMDLHICQIKDNQHYLTEEELTAATAVGPAATAAGLTYSTRLESSSEIYLKKRQLVKQLCR
jgi:hypothetical protein